MATSVGESLPVSRLGTRTPLETHVSRLTMYSHLHSPSTNVLAQRSPRYAKVAKLFLARFACPCDLCAKPRIGADKVRRDDGLHRPTRFKCDVVPAAFGPTNGCVMRDAWQHRCARAVISVFTNHASRITHIILLHASRLTTRPTRSRRPSDRRSSGPTRSARSPRTPGR